MRVAGCVLQRQRIDILLLQERESGGEGVGSFYADVCMLVACNRGRSRDMDSGDQWIPRLHRAKGLMDSQRL